MSAAADEAVEKLRTALLSGQDIPAAVRWCFYRNPAFCSTLFVVSVRRWFSPDRGIRDITDFTTSIKASRPAGVVSFPAMEAEALIRYARGETYLFDDLDPAALTYSEITVVVLAALFEQWHPNPDEVAGLLAETTAHLPALTESSLTKPIIDDWYELGMHMSPLASVATSGLPNGDVVSVLVRCGRAHNGAGRVQEALKDFNRALELDPSDALAYEGRGDSYQILQQHEDALADYDRAFSLDQRTASILVGRGCAYRDLGRHDEAFADFARAIEMGPQEWAVQAFANRGLTYMDLQRYGDAIADFTAALERDPDNSQLFSSRSQAHLQLGDYLRALSDNERAIELAPHNATLYGWHGAILRMLERYREAIEAFDRAIAAEPDEIFWLTGRGDTLLELDRPQEAITDYNRAIELASDYADPLVGRGYAHLELGRQAEAQADFRQAVQLDPSREDELSEYLNPR